jgi:nitrogen regulatory protein PII
MVNKGKSLFAGETKPATRKSIEFFPTATACHRVMKQLTIIVKPFRAEAVLQAVAELGVSACVVREAKGYSRQKGYLNRYVGSEYSMAFLPKVEISVWISNDRAEEVVERITRVARTGRIGDGKQFLLDMAWPEPLEF